MPIVKQNLGTYFGLLFLLSMLLGAGCNSSSSSRSEAECEDIDCSANGFCAVADGEAICICDDGYHSEGLSCIQDDPCEGIDCSGNGVCAVAAGEALCVCADGYRADGLNCIEETPGNLCDGVTCSGQGTCELVENAPVCNCNEGFRVDGLNCIEETPDDPCEGVTCSNRGVCAVADGEPLCVCDEGYHAEGLNCVEDDPCEGVTCSDHGVCAVRNDEPLCVCDEGYHAEGLNCVENQVNNPCEGVTCSGHGACELEDGIAVCVCNEGYHAENLNCIENDACEGITCSDRGTCVVRNDEPQCVCDEGYHAEGLDCVEDSPDDPCERVTCSNHGICAVADDEAVCICDEGYHAEGLNCVEDDPCEGISCSDHGQCVLIEGEPLCVCDEGYHAEGLNCVEDDPCEGVTCSDHGTCAVSEGQPLCVCDEGYHAEGLNCVEDDPCEGVTCSNHGQCVLGDGEPLCVCDEGYHAEGLECVEDDPCEGVDCSGDGVCAEVEGEALCICNDSFIAEGLECVCPLNTIEVEGECISEDFIGDIGGALEECPDDVFVPLDDENPTITCDYACHRNRSPGLDYDGVLGQALYAPVSGTIIHKINTRANRPANATPRDEECESRTNLGTCCNISDGFGNHVIIKDRKNREWFIGHMQRGSIIVNEGDVVQAGQRIGSVGNSGFTCSNGGDGSHIHVSVRSQGVWLDFASCVDGHGGGVEALDCRDQDRDTYGIGPDCDSQDCDDTNSNFQSWNSQYDGCLGQLPEGSVCADRDGDGEMAGSSCPWPDEDCNDFDNQVVFGCPIDDPCEGVTCSGHGQCVVENGNPACDCDNGYEPQGLNCVSVGPDYCAMSISWRSLPSIPNHDDELYVSATLNGQLHVFRGGIRFTRHYVLNSQGTSWTELNSVGDDQSLDEGLAVEFNNTIYGFGGGSFGSNFVTRWNSNNDTWTTLSQQILVQRTPTLGVIGNRIYIAGGFGNGLNLFAYEPTDDQWIIRASTPRSMEQAAGAVHNGQFYLFGGRNQTNDIYRYNPGSNSWEEFNAIWNGVSYRGTAETYEDSILVMGGELNRGGDDEIWIIRPLETSPFRRACSERLTLPEGVYFHTSEIIGNKLYIVGGYTVNSFTTTNAAWEGTISIP